jgi:hypothetical protein
MTLRKCRPATPRPLRARQHRQALQPGARGPSRWRSRSRSISGVRGARRLTPSSPASPCASSYQPPAPGQASARSRPSGDAGEDARRSRRRRAGAHDVAEAMLLFPRWARRQCGLASQRCASCSARRVRGVSLGVNPCRSCFFAAAAVRPLGVLHAVPPRRRRTRWTAALPRPSG